MTATVPPRPRNPAASLVRNGLPVSSGTWQNVAYLSNWIHGRGAQLVPCGAGCGTAIAAGNTRTFKFRVVPRYQAVQRMWTFVLRSTDASSRSTTVEIKAPSSTGTADVRVLSAWREEVTAPIVYTETLSSQAASEAEISCDIKAVDYAITVDSIGCFEVPRAALALDTSENGVDLATLTQRQPIFAGTTGVSLGELGEKAATALTTARRVGMYHAATPTTAADTFSSGGFTTASPSWEAVFDLGIPALGRFLYNGDTTRTVSCRILAWCSDGTTAGSLRVNTTSGGTAVATITIPAATTVATWLPNNAVTFSVDAENLTVTDGRRSSRWDEMTFDVQRTAGAGTIYVATISVWEA